MNATEPTRPRIVFVLFHFRSDTQDTKFIGVYSSSEAAQTAADHLATKPGFREYRSGFATSSYELDATYWVAGFSSEACAMGAVVDVPRWAVGTAMLVGERDVLFATRLCETHYAKAVYPTDERSEYGHLVRWHRAARRSLSIGE